MNIFKPRKNNDRDNAFRVAILEEPCTLLTRLRKERTEKIESANRLDMHIAALDAEITYIERHPGCDRVLQHFLADHAGRRAEETTA